MYTSETLLFKRNPIPMSELLDKSSITSEELETLLAKREAGEVDFLLVDVREMQEYDASHVKGVDLLKATSTFQEWGEGFYNEHKGKQVVIFTCRSGHRSGQVQSVFIKSGMSNVINHEGGIISYRGEQEEGNSF